jgi:ligand-binding SRPBCC domain-containing protein
VSRLEFSADVVVKCAPERAFDYFADHRHVAAVLDGVKKWEPIGAKTRGIGARYDVEMEVLGFPIRSVLRLDRWRRPREIGWVSEAGPVKQEGRFEFTPTADGVRIVLSIAYVPPASILGAAVAGPLDRVVRSRLQTALEHIREKLEV